MERLREENKYLLEHCADDVTHLSTIVENHITELEVSKSDVEKEYERRLHKER